MATQTAVDGLAELQAMQARFAPAEIATDITKLSDIDHQVLRRILIAGQMMDEIFLRQVWSGNAALRDQLSGSTEALAQARYRYLQINQGPWSRVDGDVAFVAGVPEKKPAGANLYPEDMTKEEFEGWAETLSPRELAEAKGPLHTIRRNERGLMLVPYRVEYSEFLDVAALALLEAGELTENPSLQRFLKARSNAFIFNDYFHSDCAWVDLDGSLEVAIGPYETYEDELLGLKNSFGAVVTVVDPVETAKAAPYAKYAQDLENNLPVDSEHRKPKVMPVSPIRVVDAVATYGDCNCAGLPTAFFLPTDPRVNKFKGGKQVLLQNVLRAKFDMIVMPIAERLIDVAILSYVTFEAFFSHTLCHEMSHGLGHDEITVDGRSTTVQQELNELNMTIEEAKADVCGLWAAQRLIDKGAIPKRLERALYTTFMVQAFRNMRLGLKEAHSRALAVEFNFIFERGGFVHTNGRFTVDLPRAQAAVAELTNTLLTLRAQGNYRGAKSLIDRYAKLTPEVSKALGCLSKIPMDIAPTFTTANQLLALPVPAAARLTQSVPVLG